MWLWLMQRGLFRKPESGAGGGAPGGGQAPPDDDAEEGQEPGGAHPQEGGDGDARSVAELPEWARKALGDLRRENAQHRQAKKEAQSAAQKAEEERLAQEKRWQELAEKRAQELEAAQARLNRMEREALQREVAQEAGLPPELAPRLQGDDRAAMLKDAQALAALIPAGDDNPGSPPGPAGGRASQQEMDEKREAELRSRFRLN